MTSLFGISSSALAHQQPNHSFQLTTPVARFQKLSHLPSGTSLRPATQAGVAAELTVRWAAREAVVLF
jgi:hypothetical protein